MGRGEAEEREGEARRGNEEEERETLLRLTRAFSPKHALPIPMRLTTIQPPTHHFPSLAPQVCPWAARTPARATRAVRCCCPRAPPPPCSRPRCGRGGVGVCT